MTARPKRQRKGDRLLNPGSTKEQVMCDYSLAPFDRAANEMDAKWGIDRLPALVPPEMAKRYGAAIAHLNACIEENDPEKCKDAANNCIRGLHALDAEATAAGHKPATGEYWEYNLDGWKIGILKDGAEWKTAKAARPDLTFYTMHEVANALSMYRGTIVENIKDHFPGATVESHKPAQTPMGKLIDDELPF